MKNFSEQPEHADLWYSQRKKIFESNKKSFSFRHIKMVKLLNKFLCNKEIKILDIGCGTGDLMLLFKKYGYNDVIGIDHSFVATEIANKKGLKVITCSILDELPEEITKYKYDVIVLGDILEHIYIPSAVLIKIRDILKDNGILIISVPNAGCFINGLILCFFPWLSWISFALGPWTHIRYFTSYSIKKELRHCGFDVLYLGGVPFDYIDYNLLGLRKKLFWKIINFLLLLYQPLSLFLPSFFSQNIIVLAKKGKFVDKEYLKSTYDLDL
ncbi:MAG: class I SAM-dependent methyltransferase [Candidatus Aenigmatarchaeota archaeon]